MPEGRDNDNTKPLHELDLNDESDLKDFVGRLWSNGKAEKAALEGQWSQNLAHMNGDQWLYYDRTKREFLHQGVSNDETPGRVRLAINFLRGFVESRVARLTKGRVTWNVIPSTDDQDDRDRSQHQSRVLKFLWRDLDMPRKWVDANFWVAVCHNCFLQSGWDTEAGSGLPVGPQDVSSTLQGKTMSGEDENRIHQFAQEVASQGELNLGPKQPSNAPRGEPLPFGQEEIAQFLQEIGADTSMLGADGQSVDVFDGSNTADIVPPFELIPDPSAKQLSDCDYVLRTRRRTMSYLLGRYPEHKAEIERLTPGSDDSGHDVYPADFYDSLESLGEVGKGSDGSMAETVLVHEFWHKSTSLYPQGIHAVVVDDLVLLQAENEYGDLPFVHLEEVPNPGRFWASGSFTDAVQPQLAFNTDISQLIEIMEQTCYPGVLSVKGAGLNLDTYVAEAGVINEVNSVDAVKFYSPPPIPSYPERLLEIYLDSLQRIFGDFDVSLGKPSSQASSGRAINLLAEANERRSGPVLDRLQTALAEFGEQQLRIAAHNWSTERTVWVVGDTGEREYRTVAGADLLGPDAGTQGLINFDVEVAIERRRSLALVMDQLEALLNWGVLHPQQHRQQILDAMQFEGTQLGGWDLNSSDRAKAGQENQMMVMGIPAQLSFGDDTNTHLESHLAFMRSTDYDDAIQENPQIAQLFQQHIAETYRQEATKQIMPSVIGQQVMAEMMAQAGLAQPGSETDLSSPSSGSGPPPRPRGGGPSSGGNGAAGPLRSNGGRF